MAVVPRRRTGPPSGRRIPASAAVVRRRLGYPSREDDVLVRPNQPALYAASDDDRRRSRRTRSRLRVRFLSIRPLSRTTSPVISGFITGLSLRYSHPVDFRGLSL